MPLSLAAILSATAPSADRPGVPRAQIVFAAQTLIEYQARQAVQAGARQIFIMVEGVTPFLSRTVDRFAEEGVRVHLIRDMASLMRQLPREGDVLLFADGAVIDPKYVAEMGRAEGNALLVAADEAATSHLERVDAAHRWAGLARVSAHTLFNTLDLIGDWDVVLTLMRAVVQNAPSRIVIAPADLAEGRVALIDRQDVADLLGKSLVAMPARGSAGAERVVLQWLAHSMATRLLRMQISATHIALGAIAVAVLGLVCVTAGWTIPALLLLFVALGVDMVSRQLGAVGQWDALSNPMALAVALVVSLGIVGLGAQHEAWSNGLHLGIITLATAYLAGVRRLSRLPMWAWMTPGSAVLILMMGAMGGQFGAALGLAALLGMLSLVAMLLLDDGVSG